MKRHVGQQIALATAIFCALLALPVVALFVWLLQTRGLADSWAPSALAGVAAAASARRRLLSQPCQAAAKLQARPAGDGVTKE